MIGIPSLRLARDPLRHAVAALFASGAQGAWYDESDLNTQFQDSAGTTPVTSVEQPMGRINDKSGRGNHATQATAAARPMLSARVNLLTKSEQFNDAAWVDDGSTSVGTLLIESNTDAAHGQQQGALSGNIGRPYEFSVDLKAEGRRYAIVGLNDGATGGVYAYFDLQAGVVSQDTAKTGDGWTNLIAATILALGNGEYRCKIGGTLGGSSNLYARMYMVYEGVGAEVRTYPGDGVSGIRANRAQVSTPGERYQRVNVATDYDTAGFPSYRKHDGIDDGLASPTGGGGTAGLFWCGAIKPTGGAGTVRILWSDAGSNGGYQVRINAANQLEFAAGNGTPLTPPVANTPTTLTTGGTLAAATYFYKITALNALGESLASNEVSVTTTGTTSSNTVTWGAVAGATSYRVYRGTAAGTENVYYAPGNVTSFVDTGAANTAGSPPTTTDTAYTKVATTATLPVGEGHVGKAWDDGTNLNVQIDSGAVASVVRPVVVAGTAGFTVGKDNGAATSFFTGNLYPSIYRKDSGLTAAERTLGQNYCAAKAGL